MIILVKRSFRYGLRSGCSIKYSCSKSYRPNANGIKLIELAGMIPTSVTTAVISFAEVRSYRGLNNSKFEFGRRSSMSFELGITDGYEGKAERSPSSFFVNPSKTTASENLYVSHATRTGTLCVRAIMATRAVPDLEYTAPSA